MYFEMVQKALRFLFLHKQLSLWHHLDDEFQVHLRSGAITKGISICIRMHVEEERQSRRLEAARCFRSVLKEHPFISTPILASVVTPREAGEALSARDLQRTTRASVPQTKCLSGPKDKVLEICTCDKKRGDPCTAVSATRL